MCNSICIILFVISVRGPCFNIAQNLSSYAKVAYWGSIATTKPSNQARSNGQTLWMHRSDVNIRRAQKLKEQNSPVYYYSAQAPKSKFDVEKQEPTPAKGEVEERFNPRPYFDFTFDDQQSNKKKEPTKPKTSNNDNSKPPTVVYSMPMQNFDNPPIQTLELDSKPPDNIYDSPFSSYNPPENKLPASLNYLQNQPSGEVDAKPSDSYSNADSDSSMPDTKDNSNNFHPPLIKPSSIYYGPPPPPGPSENTYNTPTKAPTSKNNKKPLSNMFGPPDVAMPNEDHSQPLPDHEDYNKEPPITSTLPPSSDDHPEYLDHPPSDHDHKHKPKQPMSMAEEDLSPPPSNGLYGNIPQYLDHEPKDHDFYHYSPHAYHEIKTTTTTTTEAPRGTGHYSYYYLGRKLWYIPLYFSIYFIIYVTFLIVKSIARHKIQFSHHFDKGRDARDINSVHQNVASSIENARNMYM